MERLFAAALVCLLLAPAAALARGHAGPAPADEYFGPYKESILGIRNHLNDLERKNDRELGGSVRGIDNEETAIEDWHAQYPQDPWLPHYLNRCVHLYARTHNLSHGNARHALGLLRSDYSRTAYARDAFALEHSQAPHHVVAYHSTTTKHHAASHHVASHPAAKKHGHCVLGVIGRCHNG